MASAPPSEGELIRNPRLAATLRKIAQLGAQEFLRRLNC